MYYGSKIATAWLDLQGVVNSGSKRRTGARVALGTSVHSPNGYEPKRFEEGLSQTEQMADGIPQRHSPGGQPSFARWIYETMRRDTPQQESTGDGAQEQLHQATRRTASGRRTQGQGVSPQRPGSSSPVVTCETCRQAVSLEFAVTCCGCNQDAHAMCHSTLVIGERFHMKMCFCCTNHVRHLLRVSRGLGQRSFHTWREDEWFLIVLNAFRSASSMPGQRIRH